MTRLDFTDKEEENISKLVNVVANEDNIDAIERHVVDFVIDMKEEEEINVKG